MFTNYKKQNNKGFTLVEMLIYVALMAIITLAVSQSLVVVLKSNRTSFAEMNIRNSGYGAMEGMLREINASGSVDLPIITGSVLQLNQNSASTTARFATSSAGALNFYKGSSSSTVILIGPLTSKGVIVKSLIFTQIKTAKSLAIRIQMQLEATVSNQTKTEWFNSTAILRGSY